ncbi:MAG: CDP-2,3-bis-(O-geranylgeranyl)-sn-glycerol synthase [Thermoprotei archaeon]
MVLLNTIYYLLPAMVANGAPVLVKRGHPIDHGVNLRDGKRIFGDGKTVEGFLFGVFSGTVISYGEYVFNRHLSQLLIGVSLSIGALIGDLVGAFIKRRLGLPRGHPAPLLDQLDFVLGAYFVSGAFNYIVGNNFTVFGDMIPPLLQLQIVITSLYIIPLIHLAANIGAYILRLKQTPW